MNVRATYIFPDDTLIAERQHMSRRMGQARKEPEPVIRPDGPADRFGATYATVLYDAEESVFKAWYTAHSTDRGRYIGNPLEASEQLMPHKLGYATSRDGVHWEKPELGLVELNGNRNNNLCDDVDTNNVVKDPHDPDASRRYKRFMYDSARKELHMLFSPDGLHWTWPTRDQPLFRGWDVVHDTHTLMGWDARLGKYVAFLRPPVILNPKRRRMVGVSMTDNVLDWPAPTVVLEADDFDPSFVDQRGTPAGMDLYCMQVSRYGEGFLGLINSFDQHLAPEGNDPINITLASSPDCRNWSREMRSPLIRIGNPGEFDGGMVYATSPPIAHDDELYIYYGAYPHYHIGWTPAHTEMGHDMRPSIGLARLRLDGFTPLYTNPYPGRLLTHPIKLVGARILVNTVPDTHHDGWLRVEIQDAEGHVLPGFSGEECNPVTTEGLYNEITWRSGRTPAALTGATVRLCITQWENVFYALRLAD